MTNPEISDAEAGLPVEQARPLHCVFRVEVTLIIWPNPNELALGTAMALSGRHVWQWLQRGGRLLVDLVPARAGLLNREEVTES